MVVFTMYDYLESILDEAPSEFDGEDVTPAVRDLFTVDLTQQKLDGPYRCNVSVRGQEGQT